MPLSDSQVKAEQAGPRRRNVSVGDSLFLVIESVSRGGGKSFEGRMRFPPGRQGKQVPVRIREIKLLYKILIPYPINLDDPGQENWIT